MNDLLLFGPGSSSALAGRVAHHLGTTLAPCEERRFEDGEYKLRPLVPVRGRDVYVLQSMYGEPGTSGNDKLCSLLFLCGALRDAGAARITAFAPYLCYARKDRRTKTRDPVTIRYVAQLVEALGIDGVITLDVHNPAAFENAFRIPAENLEARLMLVDVVREQLRDRAPVVVSPDIGGIRRAERFAEALATLLGGWVPCAFVEKRRSQDVVSGGAMVGAVADRVAVIVDDLVTTGTTLVRAGARCRAHGAISVIAVVTHALMVSGAGARLAESVEQLIVTDSVLSGSIPEGVRVVEIAPLLAEAVRRLHDDGSLVELREVGLGGQL